MFALCPLARPVLHRANGGKAVKAGSLHASVLCGFWLGVLLLTSVGCGARPYVNAHIESVNAEYRQLEDYVYALEADNARLQQELDALKTVGTSGASPAGPARSSAPRRSTIVPRSPAPASESAPSLESPTIELPGGSAPGRSFTPRSTTQRPSLDSAAPSAPADTPPNIEVPPLLEVPAPGKPSEPLPMPAGPRDILKQSSATEPAPSKVAELSKFSERSKVSDKKVTHLFLNPLQTTAADFDGRPGDDGLRIVLEPRNAAGQFVSEAGAVAIVLLDPDRQGDAARIARWDFDQSAMRQLLAASSGSDIKLEVPWPAAAPTANKLKLFVRYETADGQRLQADREIFVSAAGQAVSRWTPRSTERQASVPAAAASGQVESTSAVRSASAEIGAGPLWSPNR